ncbi:MAG: zinc ribbon domain-containing protein, partial [Myxococcales bacterium]|nr:zinc ribbon domain-containing protein [Myxococcales bacterium]
APRPGDRCAVCGTPLGPDDVVLLIKGRRVPLMAKMQKGFLANPDRAFAQLQPKSALFTEPMEAPRMRSGWFLFGLYVLVGLVFAGLTSYAAVNRGRRPVPWFFAGLAVNVLALLALLTRPRAERVSGLRTGLRKVALTHSPARCPACGFETHPSARRCPGCGGALSPSFESETARAVHES